eukprot:snap_masked-scaffold_20-processed-gene-5.65-mRNA-1 protein AED:1.00 eAED:1.00 QI:0/-1/0/0/-1/1/1/0/137
MNQILNEELEKLQIISNERSPIFSTTAPAGHILEKKAITSKLTRETYNHNLHEVSYIRQKFEGKLKNLFSAFAVKTDNKSVYTKEFQFTEALETQVKEMSLDHENRKKKNIYSKWAEQIAMLNNAKRNQTAKRKRGT